MKKETLYDIYDCALDVRLITDNLYDLENLTTKQGNIFLSFVKNGLVDEETFDYLIRLSQDISNCNMDKNMEEDLVYLITETLMDDYVNSDLDFCSIIENYSVFLDTERVMDFNYDDDQESNYYKLFITREFTRILNNIKNIDIDKLYSHDICEIMDSYKNMLDDLKSTTSISNINYNDKLKTRIKYYVDLITNKDIFELDNEKFNAVMNIASKTSNIEKLKVLKATIIFNKSSNLENFVEIVDSDSMNFNKTTIDRINKSINIKKEKDIEEEREIIKKVLKPENNA